MKFLVTLVILLALAGGGYFAFTKWKATSGSTAAVQQTEKVGRRTIEKIVSANGKVASNRDVDIKCQASGKVINLPVDISDKVKAGDLLMQLDEEDQRRSLQQAQAQLKASQARLAQAGTNLEVAKMNVVTSRARAQADLDSSKAKAQDAQNKEKRTQELFTGKLASPEDVETAHTTTVQAQANAATAQAALDEIDQQEKSLLTKAQDIVTAQAQVDQDQAKMDLQQTQLDYCKVYVPNDDSSKTADYRVSSLGVGVQTGAIVQSGSSGFSGGTTVMTLSDVSHIFVLAQVDESDFGQIADPADGAEPQRAVITLDSWQNVPFEGQVVRVARKGVTTANVTTFEVKIEVTSANRKLLRPEMTATARIIVASRPEVLAIPVSAFRKAEPGDFRRGGEAGSVPVSMVTMEGGGGDEPAATAPATGSGRRGGGRGAGGAGRGGGGGGRRGGGGGMAIDANGVPILGAPVEGTVQVLGADGKTESRPVTVGLTDDAYFEVIKGVEEGEVVVKANAGSESRFRNPNPGGNPLRGIPGGGGGGRGR